MQQVRGLVLLFLLGAGLHLGKLHYPTVTQWLVQRSDDLFNQSQTKVQKVKLKQDSNNRIEAINIQ